MNREVKQGKRSPSGTQPSEPTPNSYLTSVSAWTGAMVVNATAFLLVRGLMVGATGFEPVTPSVSAKHREPLCYPPFSQVAANRKCERETLS
jgi:hypothetical protein